MFLRKFVCLFSLFLCLGGAALAQSSADITAVPLTVDKGFPLQVLLTEKLSFKENASVHARTTEPVYAFDREVIPAGTAVEGEITGFEKAGKWSRISAMLGGDFTPVREPQITFHTLVLPDGNRIPIETSVAPGTEKVVGPGGSQLAESDLKNSLAATTKKPGKARLKTWLWGLSPYHPQYLPVGTRLSATLLEPLDFGEAAFENGALDEVGSEPPADSIVLVRLVTALDSRTAAPGTPVEAMLIRPLFSPDHRLIFPVGARVRGTVTEVSPARSRHRNGKMAFNLTTIEPPDSFMFSALQRHEVKGSPVSVGVAHDMKNLRIDENGAARIAESKKRFIAPIWAFIRAERSLGATADPFGTALLGAYRGKFLKQVTGSSGSGFGLPASISGAMVPPIGIGLGFYGAARSVYSTFLKRGRDINIPANTEMEVRLEQVTPTLNQKGESSLQDRNIP